MKKMSRLLAVIMAIAMVMSLAIVASAAEADPGYYDPSLGNNYVIEVVVPANEGINYVNCYGADGYTATITMVPGVAFAHAEDGFTFRMDGEYPLTLVGDPLLRGLAQITLTNYTAEDVTMKIVITSPDAGTEPSAPAGTWDDPAALVVSGTNTAELVAGVMGSQGYYYTWTATGNGTLSITVSGTNGWQYCMNNMTKVSYGDTHWSDDDPLVATETIVVTEGDVIELFVNTYDPANMFAAPAGTVVVTTNFAKDVGLGDNSVSLAAGMEAMYGKTYTFTAPEDGHISLMLNGGSVNGQDGIMGIYMTGGDIAVTNVNTEAVIGLMSGGVLPVTAGDTIQVQVYGNAMNSYTFDFNLTLEAHNPTEVTGTAATCTATGLTDGSVCSICEKVLIAQEEIPMAAHTPVVDAAVAATCTTTGLTEGSHCSVCTTVLVAQVEVPMAAHTPETDAAVPATCVEPGLTEGSHCSVCTKVLVAQEETPLVAHTLDKGTVTKDATCTAKGETTYACTTYGCEHTETKADIAKLAHVDEDENNTCDVCKADLSNSNTGDASMVWFVLMTVSAMALAAVVVMKKKFAI